MSLPEFLTEPGELEDLGPGDQYTLGGSEARHAAGAMRVRSGDRIQVVDGAGARITGEVLSIGDGPQVSLEVTSTGHEDPPSPQLVLVQALAKGGRDEQAIEAGTEVGADVVLPWQADRCVVRWRGPKVAKGVAKWQQTVLAATKQSRRAHLPRVGELQETAALAATVRAAVAEGDEVLIAHEEAEDNITGQQLGARAARVWILIGPEGGISPQEVDQLHQAGARPVSLGPYVLRASTAGPIALALLREQVRPS